MSFSKLILNNSNPTSVHDKLGSGDTCRCMYLASKRLLGTSPKLGRMIVVSSCWIMACDIENIYCITKFVQWFPENPTWRFQTRRTYKLQTSPSHNFPELHRGRISSESCHKGKRLGIFRQTNGDHTTTISRSVVSPVYHVPQKLESSWFF